VRAAVTSEFQRKITAFYKNNKLKLKIMENKNNKPEDNQEQNVNKTNSGSIHSATSEAGKRNGESDKDTSIQNGNPFDSENLDNESDASSKDITEQDIEKDLRENDQFEENEGAEVHNPDHNELEEEKFDIHEVESTPIHEKEFEIGELSNDEIKNDEFNTNEINPPQWKKDDFGNNN